MIVSNERINTEWNMSTQITNVTVIAIMNQKIHNKDQRSSQPAQNSHHHHRDLSREQKERIPYDLHKIQSLMIAIKPNPSTITSIYIKQSSNISQRDQSPTNFLEARKHKLSRSPWCTRKYEREYSRNGIDEPGTRASKTISRATWYRRDQSGYANMAK